ncbi:hypothetical protein TcWFU_004894 [Taenia crassiceps]|uniref:Uncharacterized protein n=1 Tax=Taenia crassiceps TaxID=6207 RepID=A0ABR4QL27_9CEST
MLAISGPVWFGASPSPWGIDVVSTVICFPIGQNHRLANRLPSGLYKTRSTPSACPVILIRASQDVEFNNSATIWSLCGVYYPPAKRHLLSNLCRG